MEKNDGDQEEKFVTPKRRSKAEHLPALEKLLAARTRMLVCFATLPVYIVGVWLLLSNGKSIDGFLMFYCVVWALFSVDMMLRKCPACGEQFYVKNIMMSFRTIRCVHCGLDKKAIESVTQREF